MKQNFKFMVLAAIIILAATLRFYKIGTNPPGLYWDEAVFGYDAYSILKTAHDHHGRFLPLFFESFGDWKLPIYHYLLVPSIAIFGLTEFAVRFPSAFFGTLTVVIFYFLVKKLTNNQILSLFCTLFLAISPWHIQFSRGGFESTAGLFFVVGGIYLFLLGLEKQKTTLFTFSFLFFTLSTYSYHAYRIFTPLLILALLIIYQKTLKNHAAKIVPAIIFSLILLMPLIMFTFSPQGRVRAISQTAFKSNEVELARIDYDQKSKKPLRFLSKYLYQKPIYYSYLAANAYFNHFSPTFLFARGDSIGRHSQVDMGQIYIFDALLLFFAVFAYKNLQTNGRKLMLAWLLFAPIPAMIVTPTPHAYRTLQMVIPLAFFSAIGAHHFFSQKKIWPIQSLIIIAIIYYLATFLHLLFIHYPQKFAADWQDGYKQMVQTLQKHQDGFEKIYITNINQVPYIYLLFYQKYDPAKFLAIAGTSNAFDKYVFIQGKTLFISDDVNVYDKGHILYVAPSWEKVDGKWLDAANDSNGRHIYSLWEVGGQD